MNAFCDEIDDDALNSSSNILKMFTKQKNRVLKLFENSQDTENNEDDDESYGLRLISKSQINISQEIRAKASSSSSNKENGKDEAPAESATNRKKSTLHIRNLSPVDIVTLSSEELSDPAMVLSSQPAPAKPDRIERRGSLRRSLFKMSQPDEEIIPVCSTPNFRKDIRHVFFGDGTKNLEEPSPIRSDAKTPARVSQRDENSIKGIEKIAKNVETVKSTPIKSLAAIEDDLRARYDIVSSPQRKTRRLSQKPAEESQKDAEETPAPSTNDCVVQLNRIEIDQETISRYRKSQHARLSVSNRTDLNSIVMVETPILHKRNKSLAPEIDSELAKKLMKCEESPDLNELTSDEEDEVAEKEKSPAKSQPNRSNHENNLQTSRISVAASVMDTPRSSRSNFSRHNENTPRHSRVIPVSRTPVKTPQVQSQNTPRRTRASYYSQQNVLQESSVNIPATQHSPESRADSPESRADSPESRSNSPKSPPKSPESRQDSPASQVSSNNAQESDEEVSPTQTETPQTTQKNLENEVFVRPLSYHQESDTSTNRIVPDEVVKSFRALSKRRVTSDSQEQVSVKINRPIRKRKAAQDKNLTAAESYINLTKKTKKNETISRKRTLYTCQSDDDEMMVEPSTEKQTKKADSIESQQVSEENEEEIEVQVEVQVEVQKKPKKKRAKEVRLDQEVVEDEGFASDSSDNHNVRYDPYKRGCQRPGLRVRRYARPWWINSGNVDDYGIICNSNGGMKEVKAELKLQKEMKKDGTRENQFLQSALGTFMKPTDKLKLYHEKRRDICSKNPKKITRSVKTSKPEKAKQQNEENLTSSGSMETCVTSNTAAESAHPFSSLIRSIRDGKNLSKQQTPSFYQCERYDMANVNNINFRDCGSGVYYGSYIESKSDGIIKLIPGGHKPRARSKNSCLKFFVLFGKLEITVEKSTEKLETFGYMSINAGSHYELKNKSDQDVIIYFTRFDKTTEN